ncbi:hypothetical protein CVT91_05190 [Candidatus Atribacteria bacterium HGW-Atribacteria-1]|nr:MAG: hypothetical protein CVT91_05190 [Candidatus Atribacteria bacterium HGW-Atribacteria-1]
MMKKYFYIFEGNKIGPFSFEELKNQNLTRETKVWFYGLDNWTTLKEVDELKSITDSIPPQLKFAKPKEIQNINSSDKKNIGNKIENKPSSNIRNFKKVIIIISILTIVLLFGYFAYNKQQDIKLYQEITASSYDTEVDFEFYVDKFYRDIGNYGIFPKKPKKTIIKFAKLDQLDNATHIHGISYGANDDDIIEIYINPSTWYKFNKPMRYFLIYHELSHDLLNVDDLQYSPENEGKLMYPALASYESKTMDDFIESSHALFEEVAIDK